MSLINLNHPATLDSGGPMESDQWGDRLDQIEGVFQSGVHGENFHSGSVRGENFRERGLTEVFRRKSSGQPWVCWPGSRENSVDVPGGALRFRLRAPASVMVFFSATIHRHNTRDVSLARHDLKSSDFNKLPELQQANFYGSFCGYWEGENKEPGDEYLQSSAIVRLRSSHDRPDVSKSIFLPWKIRPVDRTTPKSLSDVRMFSQSMPGVGVPEAGLLQAGWHNIRHTAGLLATSSDDPCLVITNTELVVVADYGPVDSGFSYDDKQGQFDSLRGRLG